MVHDVFLQALERLPTLRDPAAFGPWILAIARNRATDHHRRRREEGGLSEDLPAPPSHEDEAVRVLELIRSLPDAYRETLVLRLVEGMSGPEISERTGLKAGSVRVNLYRGMQRLREKLNVRP